MILHRCFAWSESAKSTDVDGPLWFPRIFQGEGRHDNPGVYGCLYLTNTEVSAVAEQLARFRGLELLPEMLVRRRLPLALAAIELSDRSQLIDLDDPQTLSAHDLRPSLVATRRREVTQPQALSLYRQHRFAAGLRWWSVLESLWVSVTLFDRVAARLRVEELRRLTLDDRAILEAAEVLGLAAA